MVHADFEAIVIGSGITGSWAAKELTERGLKTLLIERGRSITPEDYQGEHKGAWEFPFHSLGDRQRYESEYPIQSLTPQFGEATEQFFVRDTAHPYDQDPQRPFTWIRGYHLGGRSLTWGRMTPRWGPINFTENAKDGHGVDWPIRYEDIAPWYDYVEDFIGVSGPDLDTSAVPKGRFLPPFPMNCCEEHVSSQIAAKFPDRHLNIAPVAILTREHRGRAACHYCGPCERGCSTGSYFSSISSTLPAAEATGRLTTVTNAIVESLEHDPKTQRLSGVRVIDAKTRKRTVYNGKLIFLNASTLGSTQILLNSISEAYPSGVGNGSGVLGHYLMDHLIGTGATGIIPGMEDHQQIGNRPTGLYLPRFRNIEKQEPSFLRGYGYQGGSLRLGWSRGMNMPGFGASLKQSLRSYGPWLTYLIGFAECLPNRENRVELDSSKGDAWGIPQLKVSFEWSDNERTMTKQIIADAKEMLEAAGAVGINELTALPPGGMAVHEMGTARMGRDPRTSYLNGFNQSHEVKNLFVTDGACMTSSASQNPSLTYMALTARAADHAVKLMKQGSI